MAETLQQGTYIVLENYGGDSLENPKSVSDEFNNFFVEETALGL